MAHRKGEGDLVCRGGKWFLIAICEVPDPEVFEPVDWVGVDRGIVNLATTSDGTNHQGRRLSRYRRWQARKRAELQKKNTRSARRRLASRSHKERRHATHVNHRISKEIVSVAQRTGRGIALEQLDGIRERVRLRRDQRATLSSWPFHPLGQHLTYKARRIEMQGPWKDFDQVERAIFRWVTWYNEERLHSALDYVPPAEYERDWWRQQEAIPKSA
ncbi:transposase [Streptomyces himalayensis]|uniref:transposase n=1 Tax=Streptomyces himalayensis TaxID=2820085 RepID=UPI0028AA9357|nr:transposase [Streptomyces himalayensis]